MVFADRDDAGRRLAARLGYLRGEPVVVLGLPRGGVPVAFQVAQALGAPLDVIVVRKLGVPIQPELGMGAVGEDGVRVINPEIVHAARVSDNEVAAVQAREQAVVEARAARYRVRRPRQPLDGRVAVVVDDGIATGSTARAACQIARAQGAARVVLAVPVAPPGWQARIGADADELVCLETPRGFFAIGQFYAEFPQVSDEEVIACLDRAATPPSQAQASTTRATGGADPPAGSEEVEPRAGVVRLAGYLAVPENPGGIVVFVHGSGSSRHSPRPAPPTCSRSRAPWTQPPGWPGTGSSAAARTALPGERDRRLQAPHQTRTATGLRRTGRAGRCGARGSNWPGCFPVARRRAVACVLAMMARFCRGG